MKSRFLTVLFALIMGLVGTLGIFMYVQSLKAQAKEAGTPIEVLVAEQNVLAGVSVKEMMDKNLLSLQKIPKNSIGRFTRIALKTLKPTPASRRDSRNCRNWSTVRRCRH